MAADAVIRKARPGDVRQLAALCVEHAAYEGVALASGPGEDALHDALFGDAAPLVCWVAEGVDVADERAGKIIGYASATREFSTWQAAYFLHMDCLYLKAEGRNAGLGERLVCMLAQDALRLGCSGMQWQTPASNLRAAGFYRRIGAQSKDKLRFYLTADDIARLAELQF